MSLIIVLGVTAAVIALVGQLPDPRKVKRELAGVRLQSIGALVDGKPAAVRGTVVQTGQSAFVVSPLTHRRCVYSLLVFDEVGVAGDYVELGRLEVGVPFLLRSETGTARIVPDGARLAVYGHVVARPITAAGSLGALARGVCKQHNYDTSYLRATEYTIEPDAELTISGWCTREPLPEASDAVAGYREQLPTRPVISGSRRAKLLIG